MTGLLTTPGQKITARAERRGREQRRMPKTLTRADTFDTGDDLISISGYACVTGQGYQMNDMFGDYVEVVERGAFSDALAEGDDVRLLVNHEGATFARTKYGTLTLREILNPADDPLGNGTTGLWAEAQLSKQHTAMRDLQISIMRGDLDQMSFAFQVKDQEWSPDYTQRNIRSVKLFDVSVVSFPANDATSVTARNVEALVEQLSDDEAHQVFARLNRRFATVAVERPVSFYRAQAELLDL